MLLTHPARTLPNPEKFPTLQLFILGVPIHCASLHGNLLTDNAHSNMSSRRANRPSLMVYKQPILSSEPFAHRVRNSFPYAWKMVLDFGIGDRSTASFWAGVFISSFALAESFTGFAWGGVSDRIGRKPVLLIGCAGTLISLLIVGFSTNFWVALVGRALGGLLSG